MRSSYVRPSGFGPRNAALLEKVTDLMGGSGSRKFADFKSLSVRFRSDGITCSEYHDHCLQLVDVKTFEKFFPEMLVLLPDIPKQQVPDVIALMNEKLELNLLMLYLISFACRSCMRFTCLDSPSRCWL